MNYIGIDESRVAIELGKKEAPVLQLEVEDFAQEQAVKDNWLSWADIVTSINVQHCLLDKNHRLNNLLNMRKLLKNDGMLILTTMAGPHIADPDLSRTPRHYALIEDILAELKQAGFHDILKQEIQPATAQAKIANILVVIR